MSDRSMSVLQEADEERARRKDNPVPTARELVEYIREEHTSSRWECKLAARVEQVLALHKKNLDGAENPVCAECCRIAGEWEAWPCATVRLLNGEGDR